MNIRLEGWKPAKGNLSFDAGFTRVRYEAGTPEQKAELTRLLVAAPRMLEILDVIAEAAENAALSGIESNYIWEKAIKPAVILAREVRGLKVPSLG
jgi:hypothetical protein